MISRRSFIKRSSAALLAAGLPGRARNLWAADGRQFTYSSPFIKLVLQADRPKCLYFSTDSLGGGRLQESPLLETPAGSGPAYTGNINGNSISYYAAGSRLPAWEITCGERTVVLRTRYNENEAAPPFELAFSQKLNHCTMLGHMPAEKQVLLPGVLHLPGMGSFRIHCSQPGVTLFYDAHRFGGAQKGTPFVKLALQGADSAHPDITYTFESAAIYPDLPRIRHDERFDGFRKNYINIFQLNPRIQALANNSASDACAFTLYMYAEMAAHTPALAPGLTAMDLVRNTLHQYLRGMKAYGQVGYKAWASRYDAADSYPSLVLAAGLYILHTKDMAWAGSHYAGIREWAMTMTGKDSNGDGIIEYGHSGNAYSYHQKPFQRPANWWDDIGFGHDDAYANAIAYKACIQLARVAAALGKKEDSRYFSSFAAKLKQHYFPRFYNPATGLLGGWRSKDGKLHDYHFTFVNGIAVCYGLLNKKQSKQVMRALLEKMKAAGYNNFRMGLPGNLIPIADEDYVHRDARWGYQRFQVYENGGATACYAYFTIHALFTTGMRQAAEAILLPMLESFRQGDFEGRCPGSEMTKDWKTWNGECWGYEGFLVDNYLTFLAVLDY